MATRKLGKGKKHNPAFTIATWDVVLKAEDSRNLNSSTINTSLDKFPNIEHFLKMHVDHAKIKTKNVADQIFPDDNYYYYNSFNTIFLRLFIQKHISNQFNIKLTDAHIKSILNTPAKDSLDENPYKFVMENYEIFKDPKTRAMDIIENIKILSHAHSILFDETQSKPDVNEENLPEIIKYFQNLPYIKANLNPALDRKFFNANADIIFDNEVIYDINISKLQTVDKPKIQIRKFYNAIINGFGFYNKTGTRIQKFKIYNPILGYEYSIQLDNIDFRLFEKVVNLDVRQYHHFNKLKQGNAESLKPPILDRDLFKNNTELLNSKTIVNKKCNDFPNINHFLKVIIKDSDIKTKEVGKPGFRPDHSLDVIFLRYFIQKHLSNQLNVYIKDGHTKRILTKPDNYKIEPELLKNLIKHNEIFKDPRTQAMDIIESIKIVSLSQQIYFNNDVLKTKYFINEDKLWEVINYLRQLKYKKVNLAPNITCEYFNAQVNLVFDNDVIYDVKSVSKFQFSDNSTFPIKQFYNMIMYGFGVYKKTGKIIKKFVIYDPVYGYEYSIELNAVDFVFFEKVLERDIDAYRCKLAQLRDENVTGIDRKLFRDNGYYAKKSHKTGTVDSEASAMPEPTVYSYYTSSGDSDDDTLYFLDDEPHCSSDVVKPYFFRSYSDETTKWERCSYEESVLLGTNRSRKTAKRAAKDY